MVSSAIRSRRRRVRATFDLASVGYDRSPLRFFRTGAERLVEFAHVNPGDVVLDVGTGTGWSALAAAASTGPGGRVIGVDLSGGMLSKARHKAERAGFRNTRFRIGDAMDLPYPAHSFDVVLGAQMLWFMPNPLHALKEWRRVLRPGGRLGISSQGKAAFQPMMKMYWDLLGRYGLEVPKPSGPTFESVNECRRFLRNAGLREIRSDVGEFGYPLDTAEDWWTIVWNTGLRSGVRRLAPPDRGSFRKEHLKDVSALGASRGVLLRMPLIFVAGQR